MDVPTKRLDLIVTGIHISNLNVIGLPKMGRKKYI